MHYCDNSHHWNSLPVGVFFPLLLVKSPGAEFPQIGKASLALMTPLEPPSGLLHPGTKAGDVLVRIALSRLRYQRSIRPRIITVGENVEKEILFPANPIEICILGYIYMELSNI